VSSCPSIPGDLLTRPELNCEWTYDAPDIQPVQAHAHANIGAGHRMVTNCGYLDIKLLIKKRVGRENQP